MKKNWALSLLMSIVLLGGVFVPAGHYASAANNTTVTSDEGNSEETINQEEQELTADEQDFLDYMDALDAAGVYEQKALNATGGNTYITSSNRKSIFLTLNNTAIPNYTKYVSMLKQIKPENAELKKIHDKLIRGSYTQLEAYQLFKQAVSKTKVNNTLLKQGNDKVSAGKKAIEQYLKDVQAYAEKLGYEF
ncbi:hypothetical protein HUB98_21785 [Paenibacillus barcinonensis]|uniref:Uncharacterized protein n=1 Tax=Paenibacillus barcinonensis TaxID=198119 RepID=A0A2V4WI82_PAEBA|nr:hypothetical protein [Paenibacillus barcinonensis]PYE47244.1 hypothetical protein DFQ00_11593 [Paenibacillus barcinonensis]QKS58599.1 hypothetical protein HUB98_21785 [Paenibacillus barcinonensis]